MTELMIHHLEEIATRVFARRAAIRGRIALLRKDPNGQDLDLIHPLETQEAILELAQTRAFSLLEDLHGWDTGEAEVMRILNTPL